MPYAEPYVYVRAIGSFGLTAGDNWEQWSAGMKLRNPGVAPTALQLVSFTETVKGLWSTYHNSSSAGTGSSCWLKEIQSAFVGTDGKYVGGASQNTTRSALATPVQGQGTGANLPQAIVISLRTSLTRGPGSNGRIYMPALGLGVAGTSGLINPSTTALVAGVAKTLIDGINSAADTHLPGSGGVSVMSQVSTGVAATVTSIRVGNKMDHMESRERDLTEVYATQTISTVSAFVAPDPSRLVGSTIHP